MSRVICIGKWPTQKKSLDFSPLPSGAMYLVLIETSGNQNFIFSTNKLRENIGASELTYRSGTQWVMEAVAQANGNPIPDKKTFESSSSFRAKLLDAQFNPPIDNEKTEVEIIIATSGKALLLAKKEDKAQEIVKEVTKRALLEAPGLDICGATREFAWEKDNVAEVNRQLHQEFEVVRSSRSGPESRFLRLPVVAECSTSGLPAARAKTFADKTVLRSCVSQGKRDASTAGFERIQKLLPPGSPQRYFLKTIDQFGKADEPDDELSNSWLAVVHADGNGLGQIFLDFGKYTNGNRDYVDKYRQFSLAIDICTEKAFIGAIEAVFINGQKDKDEITIPMVPLILGGDDLTVVCDGQRALQFTQEFLQQFEDQTQEAVDLPHIGQTKIVAEQAEKHLQVNRLSACAGVAVVKNHFPFSIAYGLAEQLIKSAKKVKEIVKDSKSQSIPCSAIDYHILYDSSSVDLESIRSKLWLKNSKSRLYGRPYVVSPKEKDWYKDSIATAWLDRHHWSELAKHVETIKDKDDDGRYQLPNSQMHDLREALFLGQQGADNRYRLISHRYEAQGIRKLEGNPESLFWQEQDSKDGEINITGFLDAMDAAGFWQGGKANV
jgi:hypothetical protein